ncbi:MAG: hypothetical protein ACJAZ2_000899 [Glaciecola sp.]
MFKARKVFFVLLSSMILLLLVLLIPTSVNDDFDLISLPTKNDFVPLEVERVNTIYGSKQSEHLYDISILGSASTKNKKIYSSSVPEDEKIIHSSDFDNDLKFFYQALNKLSGKDTLIRVLHFGDSQIEGDRVSGKLRQSFQNLFGGCGTGFMPVSEHRVNRLNVIKYVAGWDRYKVFGSKASGPHNKYGFLGYYHKMDSANGNSYIQIKKKRRYFKGVNRAEKFTMLYSSLKPYKRTDVLVKNHTQKFDKEVVEGFVRKRTWSLDSFQNNSVNIKFKHDTAVDIYGISFDCKRGLAIDNVGLRGSSGTEFTKIDEANLKSQLQLLNVNLIVYQFGVNVIPYVVDDYKYYENMVFRQLKLFKRLVPDAAILVVGVSDMCQKKDGKFQSFPNIKKVILAQRNAAKRAKCAFWDLQKVMGGEGSMKNWVNAEPPLGEKDYTHFSRRGANLVGEKMFNALMSDFNNYTLSP